MDRAIEKKVEDIRNPPPKLAISPKWFKYIYKYNFVPGSPPSMLSLDALFIHHDNEAMLIETILRRISDKAWLNKLILTGIDIDQRHKYLQTVKKQIPSTIHGLIALHNINPRDYTTLSMVLKLHQLNLDFAYETVAMLLRNNITDDWEQRRKGMFGKSDTYNVLQRNANYPTHFNEKQYDLYDPLGNWDLSKTFDHQTIRQVPKNTRRQDLGYPLINDKATNLNNLSSRKWPENGLKLGDVTLPEGSYNYNDRITKASSLTERVDYYRPDATLKEDFSDTTMASEPTIAGGSDGSFSFARILEYYAPNDPQNQFAMEQAERNRLRWGPNRSGTQFWNANPRHVSYSSEGLRTGGLEDYRVQVPSGYDMRALLDRNARPTLFTGTNLDMPQMW